MNAAYNRNGDVSLERVCNWTSCRTHHSNMDAPQYVQVDVPSEYIYPWMFYYTHHSDMDAP
jgi:hypothetical protein